MIGATKITITRAEGPHHLCGLPQTFDGHDCWTQASRWLWTQSHTFPAEGGYDKHDFKVTFADGDVFEGRLDCKHHSCEDPDIDVARHVRRFCQVHAGHYCPAGMSDKAWERFLDRTREDQQRYQDFLERHWIPDMPFEKSDATPCAG